MKIYLTSQFQLNSRYVTESGQVLYRSKTPLKGAGSVTTISKVIPNTGAPYTVDLPRFNSGGSPSDEVHPNFQDSSSTAVQQNSRNPFLHPVYDSPEQRRSKSDLAQIDDHSEGHAAAEELEAETKGDGSAPSMMEKTDIGEEEDVDMQDRYAHMATIKWNVFASSKLTFGGQVDLPTNVYFGRAGFGPRGRSRAFTAANGREYKWKMGWWTPTLCLDDGTDTPVVRYYRKHFGLGRKDGTYLEIVPGHGAEDVLDEVIMSFIYVETIRKRRERAARSAHGS